MMLHRHFENREPPENLTTSKTAVQTDGGEAAQEEATQKRRGRPKKPN